MTYTLVFAKHGTPICCSKAESEILARHGLLPKLIGHIAGSLDWAVELEMQAVWCGASHTVCSVLVTVLSLC